MFGSKKMGYLKRMRSRDDRRKILIYRTEKDKAMENKYIEASQEMTILFYKGFALSEINRFETDLKRILNNLTSFETNPK
jgi:DNA-binding MarR family transcriptional regulator